MSAEYSESTVPLNDNGPRRDPVVFMGWDNRSTNTESTMLPSARSTSNQSRSEWNETREWNTSVPLPLQTEGDEVTTANLTQVDQLLPAVSSRSTDSTGTYFMAWGAGSDETSDDEATSYGIEPSLVGPVVNQFQRSFSTDEEPNGTYHGDRCYPPDRCCSLGLSQRARLEILYALWRLFQLYHRQS